MNKSFYAVKNKNDKIRLKSSSGGVFYNLALYVLKNGGVVYGAVYDSNCNIIHKRIDRIEDICLMQGSKYSNSNLTAVFNQLKIDSQSNIRVLFSGTPCQIMIVKKFLDKYNIDNFLFVDVICHGTPSKKFYDDYKKMMEKKFNSQIVNINMRYKNKKDFDRNLKFINPNYNEMIGNHTMLLTFANGKQYLMPSNLDVFYLNFDYFISKGCFECKYSNMKRISDITIGDFHQFKCNLGTFNDCNGISLVILNSKQGHEVFNHIKREFEYLKKNEYEIYQPALYSPTLKPKKYDEFQKDYENYGFEFIIKKYTPINLKYKIKIFLYKVGLYEMLRNLKLQKNIKIKWKERKNENKN